MMNKNNIAGNLTAVAVGLILSAGLTAIFPKPAEPHQPRALRQLSEGERTQCETRARQVYEVIARYGGPSVLGDPTTVPEEFGACLDGELRRLTQDLPEGQYCFAQRSDVNALPGQGYFEVLHQNQSLYGRKCPKK